MAFWWALILLWLKKKSMMDLNSVRDWEIESLFVSPLAKGNMSFTTMDWDPSLVMDGLKRIMDKVYWNSFQKRDILSLFISPLKAKVHMSQCNPRLRFLAILKNCRIMQFSLFWRWPNHLQNNIFFGGRPPLKVRRCFVNNSFTPNLFWHLTKKKKKKC